MNHLNASTGKCLRTRCIVCGAPLFKNPIYVLNNMPASSQDLPTEENLSVDKPVAFNLCQCSGCGLVQFNSEPVFYYKDSTRAGERTEGLIKLRHEQYKHLIETYHLLGKKILEVGAGKGGFLKSLVELKQYGVKAYGIENNPEYVRIAQEVEHVNVIQGYTETENTAIAGAPFDAFVSFAYPARLIDPNTMMRCIYNNTTDTAVGLIQVASLEHLVRPGGFFDITQDHIAYYDKNTLSFLMEKNGFEVLETGDVHQIYIYAIVRKRKPLNLEQAWTDIAPLTVQVQNFVKESTENGKKIAVWCAGHFAFTVLSVAQIGSKVSYIIDNAKFKQNHYSPASHVPIYGPDHFREEPVDTILILGPIYIDEILKDIRTNCSQTVRIAAMDKTGLKYGL